MSSTVAKINNPAFCEALRKSTNNLSPDEYRIFLRLGKGSPEELLRDAQSSAENHAQSSISRKLAKKTKPWFQGIKQYHSIVKIFIQSDPTLSSLLIGGILCVLQIGILFAEYFERILAVLGEIDDLVDILSDYAINLYRDNDAVQNLLVNIYGLVFEFCAKATSTFLDKNGKPKSGLRTFARLTWQPFEVRYKEVIDELHWNIELLERETLRADRHKVKDFRNRAYSHFDVFDNFVSQRNLADKNSKRDRILDWLPSVSFKSDHETLSQLRQNGTCNWLLAHTDYINWRKSNDSSLLWSFGGPGCGKTIISSTVVNELKPLLKRNDTFLAYAYINSRNPEKSDPTIILGSMLEQICRQQDVMPQQLETLFDDTQAEGLKKPSWPDFCSTFIATLSLLNKVYLIIDGLDECDDVEKFSEFLVTLTASQNIKIFVASRPGTGNRTKFYFSAFPSINVMDGNKDDLKIFIKSEISLHVKKGKLCLSDVGLEEEIKTSLIGKADGMSVYTLHSTYFIISGTNQIQRFLWVKFQTEALSSQTTDYEIREALETLPEGLQNVYIRALESIHSQPPPKRRLAKKVLMWTTFAKRQLHLSELIDAIATEPGVKSVNPSRRISNKDLITGVCADLITIDEQGIVQATHSSVRDFLLGDEALGPVFNEYALRIETASYQMADISLTYVTLFADHHTAPATTKEELLKRIAEYPLIRYAAEYWSDHILDVKKPVLVDQTMAYIDKSEKKLDSVRQLLRSENFDDDKRHLGYTVGMTHLHVIASRNLIHLLNCIDTSAEDLNAQDSQGRTPLLLAAHFGNEEPLRHLIEKGADVNTRSNLGHIPLLGAIQGGFIDCAKLLIYSGADIDFGSRFHALVHASLHGNLKIMEIILSKMEIDGINPNISNIGTVAIAFAAYNNHVEAAKLLIAHGADINGDLSSCDGPLHNAALNDHTSMVSYLLSVGANINALDTQERTALYCAVKMSHVSTVSLLLTLGADPNIYRKDDLSCLYLSISMKKLEIIKLLVRHDSYLNGKTPDGVPLLQHYVAYFQSTQTGNKSTLQIEAEDTFLCKLINLVADVNSIDSEEVTVAHKISAAGKLGILRHLVDAGADLKALDSKGHTCLHSASYYGHTEVVDMLIEQGIDINACTKRGDTALHLAAECGHIDIVHRLVATSGIKLDGNSLGDFTPLMSASLYNNCARTVAAILEAGADVNAFNSHDGFTALHYAVEKNKESIAKVLIAAGCNVNSANSAGKTALYIAAHYGYGYANLLKRLLAEGASPLAKVFWDIPIITAANAGHTFTVCLLAPYHADLVGAADQSLLHLAASLELPYLIRSVLRLETSFAGIKLDSYGWDPLHVAIYFQCSKAAEALCQSLRFFAADDWKEMVLAILHEDTDYIRNHRTLAIQTKTLRNTLSWSPVHVAVLLGRFEALKELLSSGWDLNSKDINGMTALHWAYASGHMEIVEHILDLGGDEQELDKWCRLPIHLGWPTYKLPESEQKSDNDIIIYPRSKNSSNHNDINIICDDCNEPVDGYFAHCAVCLDADFDRCESCILQLGKGCKDMDHVVQIQMYHNRMISLPIERFSFDEFFEFKKKEQDK